MKNTILAILIIAAIIAALFALDCGIIYLICLCFNWKFQWKIAIGIMLLLSLVGSFSGEVQAMQIKFTVPGALVLANSAPLAFGKAESSQRSVARPLPRQTVPWFASDYTKGCSHED